MRSILIGTLLLAIPDVRAQSWCPPGAVWVYHYEGLWATEYREEHRYTNDTVVGGIPAQAIQVHEVGTWFGGPLDVSYTEVTALSNDVVLHLQSGAVWDTLYWFGDIGDRWWPINSPM